MAYRFFESGIQSGAIDQSPNDEMREMLQAYVNEQWDNTTAIEVLQEQNDIGSNEYTPVEAMIANLIDLTSTGKKSGQDFIRVFFRNFKHPVIRGRYYQYADNYWIVDDVSLYEGVAPLITLRKCNNSLRMIDPSNGEIFIAPCVVNYDMTSPSPQVSRYVITPNNHAEIIVQANVDTMRLFTLNTRFILGGRPFKLLSYQNALLDDLNNQVPTIMYLDLYLDEIHAKDDLENRIADNGSKQIDEQVVLQSDGIYIVPSFNKIRQYESKQFDIVLIKNGKSYDIDNSQAVVSIDNDKYARIVKVGDGFDMYCNAISKVPLNLHIDIPSRGVSQDFAVECVSMIGG